MADLEKLTVNGNSYFLADRELRQAVAQMQTVVAGLKITDTAAGESLHLTDSAEDFLAGLKLYVSASQAGEGVPSAENVRPISPIPTTVTVRVADNAAMDGAVSYDAALPENMYGGYYDWERGVFVQTHEYVTLQKVSLASVGQSGANSFYVVNALHSSRASVGGAHPSQVTGLGDSFAYGSHQPGRTVYCSGQNVWFVAVPECNTPEELRDFLLENPLNMVYPLQNPVEHPLENAPALQVKTSCPETFITTTGTALEATYVADPKRYIAKKIKEATGENV